MIDFLLLACSLFLVIKSADFAIKYATRVAYILRLPRYVIGFLVVAVISILPETFIAIDSSLRGIPSFGLGTLFGSNVADLTLVFAIIIFSTAGGIKVSSKILEENRWYPLLLAFPIFVGFDGHYSRTEGVFLIAAGLLFYYLTFKKNYSIEAPTENHHLRRRNILLLIISMAALLLGSHLTVKYGVAFAESVHLNPVLIGMLIVGLGTTLPELFFSLKAVREKESGLALGDILGTVVSDATIAVGIVALISPFYFSQKIVYITAAFMVLASFILLKFMRSGKILTKKEGILLFLFYAVFILTEYTISQ